MAGFNSFSLNSSELNSGFEVLATGAGALIDVEQRVAHIGSGALIDIEQSVNLHTTGSGVLISIDQQVRTIGSGALISLGQQVLSAAQKTFFDKNGWDGVISLGGYNIPRNQIQDFNVVHSINDDARAVVTLNPGSATYDLYSYQGKQLIISVRTGDTFKRIFTGNVDIPRVELINEKIVLEAVASRETLIRNQLTPFVPTIGYYSDSVFGEKRNVFQETNDRMQTIPSDLDFDAYNNWSVNSWAPKASPDYTLGNSDLYREQQPTIRIESAREIVNKVVIDVSYAYQRLHQINIAYSWSIGNLTAKQMLDTGNTLPSKTMIVDAARAAGWLVENMSFTSLWDSGFYSGATGPGVGWVSTSKDISLSATGATDSNGNNYSSSTVVGQTSVSNVVVRGAQWSARRRFAQNIKEDYTLTVNSPQSQSLYGVREQNQQINIQSEFDEGQWEDDKNYNAEFTGTRYTSSGDSNTYYINKDLNNTELNNAMVTALNQAKTSILKSHRDTEVTYRTFIDPDIALRHTVSISATRLTAKGKVKTITHSLNAEGEATTEVSLLMYRASGSQAESSLSPVSRPAFSNPDDLPNIALVSRWGQDPSSAAATKWTGYIGNKWITVATGGTGFFGMNTNTYLTTYQESFVVDTPQIPDNRRTDILYTASQSYNIAIPTDNLSITFIDS